MAAGAAKAGQETHLLTAVVQRVVLGEEAVDLGLAHQDRSHADGAC